MSDLIERLRALCKSREGNYDIRLLAGNAADKIKRLERELAEAREWIEETGHRISCPWRHTKLTSTDLWPACDCGYIAILAEKTDDKA
jgi:hypothetical protein